MLNRVAMEVATHPGAEITGVSKAKNADVPYDVTPRANTDVAATAAGYQLKPAGSNLVMPRLDPHTNLHRLRMRFPGLPIVPLPNAVRSLKLAANVAQDMQIPSDTVGIMFHASGPFYMDAEAAAAVPSGASDKATSLLITPPWPFIYYVFGKNQLSFIAENICTVQALCFIDVPEAH